MEPRLVVFQDHQGRSNQGFIVAEEVVLLKLLDLS